MAAQPIVPSLHPSSLPLLRVSQFHCLQLQHPPVQLLRCPARQQGDAGMSTRIASVPQVHSECIQQQLTCCSVKPHADAPCAFVASHRPCQYVIRSADGQACASQARLRIGSPPWVAQQQRRLTLAKMKRQARVMAFLSERKLPRPFVRRAPVAGVEPSRRLKAAVTPLTMAGARQLPIDPRSDPA